MSNFEYALENVFNPLGYQVKKESIYSSNKIKTIETESYKNTDYIEESFEDLFYQNFINILRQQELKEHKKTNIGIEQLIEKIEQKRIRSNVYNKVRSIFTKSSSLCSILSFTTVFIYYLAVLERINLNPIYVIIWMPISFGAWLTSYINYEIWISKNGRQ